MSRILWVISEWCIGWHKGRVIAHRRGEEAWKRRQAEWLAKP